MGYSVFSSKAFIFYKKCQICYLSGRVALKDNNTDRSGNNLNSKFTRGFLALDCQALAACCFIYSEKATKFCEISTLDLLYVVPVKFSRDFAKFCGLLRIYEYELYQKCSDLQ